jgi:hypothetical protein
MLEAGGKVTRSLLVIPRRPVSTRALARASCTPGPKTVGGKTVVFFCGPAKATVHLGAKTITYRNGACTKGGGTFSVNIGATIPGASRQKYPYFGLMVDGARPGRYTRQNVAFASTGTVYAIGQHTILLKPGLRSGTFSGRSFPGGRPVLGSFTC